jgi:Amt family ammonium transporter
MQIPTTLSKAGIGTGLGLLAGMLATGGIAFAQEGDEIADAVSDLIASVDTLWLLISAFLVFFMQAGFGLLEAGFVRVKNTSNILMKNAMDASLGILVYWAIGFGLAYGTAGSFAGFDKFFATPAATGDAGAAYGILGDIPLFATFIFQWAFAATAATIVSGAMAERTQFRAYLFYTVFITAIIYPIVSHWVWGGGWLSDIGTNGFLDFAGSTVVHGVGAWAGLVGAFFVGARIGKYGEDGRARGIPGHSMPLAALGMFILWFGWYGFNGGSTLALTGGGATLAALVVVNTTLSAGAGAVAAMGTARWRHGKTDLGLTLNGALAGLVGITAGAGFVEPYAAVIIGLAAGVLVVFSVSLLDRARIDDPIGAISVHGVVGVWGTLAVGLFATANLTGSTDYGLLTGGGIEQLGVQVVGILAVFAWTVVTSAVLFGGIKMFLGLRVSEAEEIAGLDVQEHGIGAYPEFPTVAPGTAVETSVDNITAASGD